MIYFEEKKIKKKQSKTETIWEISALTLLLITVFFVFSLL